MYTSLGLVVLAGFISAPSMPEGPAWRLHYGLARQEGQKGGKPLAVLVGSGRAGFHKVSAEGRLSRQSQRLLAANYVPVYVDASTPAGRRLAAELGISQGRGIVISDSSGDLQAFYHDGDLAEDTLTKSLRRYADPKHVVRTTERVQTQQVTYYQAPEAPAPVMQPYNFPAYPAGFGGFGGGLGGGFGGGFGGGGGRC